MERYTLFAELQKEILERVNTIFEGFKPEDSLVSRYITLDESGAHISHQYVRGTCEDRYDHYHLTPEEIMGDIPTMTAELKRRKEEEEAERWRMLTARSEKLKEEEEAERMRLVLAKIEEDKGEDDNEKLLYAKLKAKYE